MKFLAAAVRYVREKGVNIRAAYRRGKIKVVERKERFSQLFQGNVLVFVVKLGSNEYYLGFQNFSHLRLGLYQLDF